MANDKQERSKNFKQSVDTKRMFIKSDSALTDHKPTATTISSSDYNKFSASFAAGDHLLDDAVRENMGPFMYVIDTLQGDIEDIHAEVSTSMYESTVGTFTKFDTGSFGIISSSLTPDADDTYDLGSSGTEWKDLYIDGVANVDELSLGVISTDLIPKTAAKKGSGQNIGSDKVRWSKIYLASHIDVSGSELVISSPSASVAGDEFNVIVSGSIVPGDTASGSIGTIDAPFKDLYVQSSSIFFADMSDHNGKSWKQMSKSERLARTTTFHKDDIDKMKQGKSLNDSGDIKAEGDLEVDGTSTLTGQTTIEGKTIIKGITELSGSVSAVGNMDIRGGFKVNGTSINNLRETLDYAKGLLDTGVTSAEFDKLDGLSATTDELNLMDGVTATTAELNILKGVTATKDELNIMDGVTATTAELNKMDGVTVTAANINSVTTRLSTDGGAMKGPLSYGIQKFEGDSPQVNTGNIFTTNNSKSTKVSAISKGGEGQEITIIAKDTNTTLAHGGANKAGDISLSLGTDYTMKLNDTINLVCDGKFWFEKSRSQNSANKK